MSLPRLVTAVRTIAERSRAPPRFGLPFSARPRQDYSLTTADIDSIHSAMLAIRPEELGFGQNVLPQAKSSRNGVPTRREPISFIHVAENEDFLMAIFVMPPGSFIPTHSHPSTYVFTRVLFGELVVQEYDFLVPPSKVVRDRDIPAVKRQVSFSGTGEARYLTPSYGNVHSFEARSWTALFDLIVPPYAAPNRLCRYYAPVRGKEPPNGPSLSDSEHAVYLRVSRAIPAWATRDRVAGSVHCRCMCPMFRLFGRRQSY
jgi:hypothetical protein